MGRIPPLGFGPPVTVLRCQSATNSSEPQAGPSTRRAQAVIQVYSATHSVPAPHQGEDFECIEPAVCFSASACSRGDVSARHATRGGTQGNTKKENDDQYHKRLLSNSRSKARLEGCVEHTHPSCNRRVPLRTKWKFPRHWRWRCGWNVARKMCPSARQVASWATKPTTVPCGAGPG